MNPPTEQVSQINVEYFFRLIYQCFHGGCYSPLNLSWLTNVWIWITIIGYILSIAALFVIVYSIVKLFELRAEEHEYYTTLIAAPKEQEANTGRWAHIQELIASDEASKWREAIIEADIMLEEVLRKQGFTGSGVGEQLQGARFATIIDAGEAHGVRNRIAHDGSAYDLTESLARRTIAKYGNVFREFHAI